MKEKLPSGWAHHTLQKRWDDQGNIEQDGLGGVKSDIPRKVLIHRDPEINTEKQNGGACTLWGGRARVVDRVIEPYYQEQRVRYLCNTE